MKAMKKALLFLVSAALLLGVVFATCAAAYTPTADFPAAGGSQELKNGETKVGTSNVSTFEDMLIYTTLKMDGTAYSYKEGGYYSSLYGAGASKTGTHETVTEVAADGTLNTYLNFYWDEAIKSGGSNGKNSDANCVFKSTASFGSTYYYVVDFDVKTNNAFPGLAIYMYSREASSNKHYARIVSLSGNTANFYGDVTQTIETNEWHHITAVYAINKGEEENAIGTSEMKIYLDGTYVTTFLSSSASKNLTDLFLDNTPEVFVGWTGQTSIAKDTSVCFDNFVVSAVTSENDNLATLFADTDPVTDLKTANYPEIAYGEGYTLPTPMADVEAYTVAEDGTVTTYATLTEAITANPDGDIYLNKDVNTPVLGTAKVYTMGYNLNYTCDGTTVFAAESTVGTEYPQDDFVLFHSLSDDQLAVFNYYDLYGNLVATQKIPEGCVLTHPNLSLSVHSVTFTDGEETATADYFKSWIAYDTEGVPTSTPTMITSSELGKVYTMEGSYERSQLGIAVKAPDGKITVYVAGTTTLNEAITSATAGSVVKLFEDQLQTATATVDNSITIDLNGYAVYTTAKLSIFKVTGTATFELYSSREGGGIYCGVYGPTNSCSGMIGDLQGTSITHIGWTDKNGDGVLNEEEKCYRGNLTLTGSTIAQHAGTSTGDVNVYGTTCITSAPDNSAMFMLRKTASAGVKTLTIDSCELYVAGVRASEEFFGFRETVGTHNVYVSNSLLASYNATPVDIISYHGTSDTSTNHVYFTGTTFMNVTLVSSTNSNGTATTTLHVGEDCYFSSYTESEYLVFEDAEGNPLSVARITPVTKSYTLSYYSYAYYQPDYLATRNVDTAMLYTATTADKIAAVTWDFGEGNETLDKTESWVIGSLPYYDGETVTYEADGTLLSFDTVVTTVTGAVTFTAIESATADSLGLMHDLTIYESLDYHLYIPVALTSIKTLTIGGVTIDVTTLPKTSVKETTQDDAGETIEIDVEYYVLTVNEYAPKDAQKVFDITFSFETARGTTPSAVISIGLLSYLDDLLRDGETDANTKTLAVNILEYAKASFLLFNPKATAEDTAGFDALLGYCERSGIAAYVAKTVSDPLDEGDLSDAFEYAALNLVSTPEYVFTLREGFSGTVTVDGVTYTVTNGLTEDGKSYILYTPTLAAFNDGVEITVGESGKGAYSIVSYILSQVDIDTFTFPVYAEALYNLSEFVSMNFVAEELPEETEETVDEATEENA